ncbi:hypothetical protein TanjilG_20712 [Lupinus angustifolius]|uniref:Uncharacterized protein n=1 Tax=Lupinus angustifolius TaxID=3871 RepID=A0A4P1QRH9_LUPAN|nr:hypothetical protein TanjilG_20712 [Lupinus angustifolius]
MLKHHIDNSWSWIHDINGKYSVIIAYQTLRKWKEAVVLLSSKDFRIVRLRQR